MQKIKIGSRVRYTGNAVHSDGTITWCSGTHVKIEWENGEKSTWKRSELEGKNVTLLGLADEPGETPATEVPETPPAGAAEPEVDQTATADADAPEAKTEAKPVEEQADVLGLDQHGCEHQPGAVEADTPVEAKPKRQRKAAAAPKEKKVSCLDAAAKVLGEAGQPMTCQEMIEAMAKKGYWSSPGGQTPAATLYSAILRELTNKGTDARFVKTERGKFGPKA